MSGTRGGTAMSFKPSTGGDIEPAMGGVPSGGAGGEAGASAAVSSATSHSACSTTQLADVVGAIVPTEVASVLSVMSGGLSGLTGGLASVAGVTDLLGGMSSLTGLAGNVGALSGLNSALGGALGNLSGLSGLGSNLAQAVAQTASNIAGGHFESIMAQTSVIRSLNVGLQPAKLPSLTSVPVLQSYLGGIESQASSAFGSAGSVLSQISNIKAEAEAVIAEFS